MQLIGRLQTRLKEREEIIKQLTVRLLATRGPCVGAWEFLGGRGEGKEGGGRGEGKRHSLAPGVSLGTSSFKADNHKTTLQKSLGYFSIVHKNSYSLKKINTGK